MKTYSQYIKENQKYLTDPYDPEFVISIQLKEQIDTILQKLRELSNRLGLNVRTTQNNKGLDLFHIIYEGDVKLPSGGVMTKKCTFNLKYHGFAKRIILTDSNNTRSFNTLEEIENYLKTYFEL